MFACMPCRSNCSRGFFNDEPEILMQQSTNIINLIESPDFLCLESFDFSEVNAAHAVACFFFLNFFQDLPRSDLRTPVELAHALWCGPWVQLAGLAINFCSCKAL